MSRHWGRPLNYEALAERIELLNVERRRPRRRRQPRDARRARRHAASTPTGFSSTRTASIPIATRRRLTARPCAAARSRRARPSSASSRRFSPGTAPRCWRTRSSRLMRRASRLRDIGAAADDRRRTRSCAASKRIVADAGLGRERALHRAGRAGRRGPSISRPATSSRRRTCRTPTARRFSDRRPSCSSTWRWGRPSSRRISIRSARCCATARPRGWCRQPMPTRWRAA